MAVFDLSPPSRVDDLSRLVEAGGEAVAVELGPPHALRVQLDELRGAAADRVHVGAALQQPAPKDGAPGRTDRDPPQSPTEGGSLGGRKLLKFDTFCKL